MQEYRELCLAWHRQRWNVPRANRLMGNLVTMGRQLRQSREGQQALLALLSDEEPIVRRLAATQALQFGEMQFG